MSWRLYSLVHKKYSSSKHVIGLVNWISKISILGLTVGVAALIIVISVYNGLETIIYTDLNHGRPTYIVYPAQGSTFKVKAKQFKLLQQQKEINNYFPVLESKIIIQFQNRQQIAEIKGIDSTYFKKLFLPSDFISSTIPTIAKINYSKVVLPLRLVINLGLDYYQNKEENLQLFAPNKNTVSLVIENNFNQLSSEFEDVIIKYLSADKDNTIYAHLSFVSYLLNLPEQIYSKIEIYSKESMFVLKQLKEIFPEEKIISNVEENAELYAVVSREKWLIFIILFLIILITSFNLFGTLMILVIEKRKDIQLFYSMGISYWGALKIFLFQGIYVSLKGLVYGCLLGYLIAGLQWKFKFIKFSGDSFVINYYPISFKFTDFMLIVIMVLFIGFIISFLPANIAAKRKL